MVKGTYIEPIVGKENPINLNCLSPLFQVKFYLNWTDLNLESDESPSPQGTLCHPLCQCAKCQGMQRVSQIYKDNPYDSSYETLVIFISARSESLD